MSVIATDINPARRVLDLAVELPNATRVFERFGIDYCCGGKKPLGEVCQAANLNLDEVLKSLDEACRQESPINDTVLQSGSLAELIDHIVKTHHKFTRDEIVTLQALATKVCSVHGKNHPELHDIRDTFTLLAQDLSLHLMKEEQVLFPYIVRLEEASLQSEPILPAAFGPVTNPIYMMTKEHDSAGELLRKIRTTSNNFRIPEDVCISYRTLYERLEGFESDLHQHIHKENNLLFPKAIEMESAGRH